MKPWLRRNLAGCRDSGPRTQECQGEFAGRRFLVIWPSCAGPVRDEPNVLSCAYAICVGVQSHPTMKAALFGRGSMSTTSTRRITSRFTGSHRILRCCRMERFSMSTNSIAPVARCSAHATESRLSRYMRAAGEVSFTSGRRRRFQHSRKEQFLSSSQRQARDRSKIDCIASTATRPTPAATRPHT